MKQRMYCLALLLATFGAAQAATISLEGELGCDSIQTQQLRVQLTRVIMTTDNEQAKEQATRRLDVLNQTHCTPLSGIFTISEKAPGLLKITTKEGAQLWLVE